MRRRARTSNTGDAPARVTAWASRRWDRLRFHASWARSEGVAKLIEEDNLNPMRRWRLARAKARWRDAHARVGPATPVFVVGVQRSGTNLLLRTLEARPDVEVYNENNRAAFRDFRLRAGGRLRDLVDGSPYPFVAFKPLCDSHSVVDLLDGLATTAPGRAIWVFRNVEPRVRSAVAKFGDNNLTILRAIAHGRGDHLWQAQGLTDNNRALLESFDYSTMTPESAAALFWYVRNSLYFGLELDRRDDVFAVAYEGLTGNPERTIESICAFLGMVYSHEMALGIMPSRLNGHSELDIDPRIRRLASGLQERMIEASAADQERWRRGSINT